MQVSMTRVARKVQVAHFDEEEIRKAFMAGERPSAIAAKYDPELCPRIAELILEKRHRWIAEEPFNRELSDDRRLFMNRLHKADNTYWIIRVPVARISMHVAHVTNSLIAKSSTLGAH